MKRTLTLEKMVELFPNYEFRQASKLANISYDITNKTTGKSAYFPSLYDARSIIIAEIKTGKSYLN